METVWIAAAFIFGLVFQTIGFPSLIGFLAAGFLLKSLGIEGGDTLRHVAHFGVLLLLFSLGLKINLKNLFRPVIWGTAIIHSSLMIVVLVPSLYLMSNPTWNTAVLLACTLALSSTVLAAKTLEEKRETGTFHGRIAIGILIMQDLMAVALLAFSSGQAPSPWALTVFLLPVFRPILFRLTDLCGHGEMLLLYGILLAVVVGGMGFEFFGLSGELGALVLGAMLAKHPKASELARGLWGLKEIFLIGFFLQIGMAGVPSLNNLYIAIGLALLLPFKTAFLFFILVRFKLRARSALLSALSLGTYSEFALIVAQLAYTQGWLTNQWLTTLAVSVALSYMIAAPVNRLAHGLYQRGSTQFDRFQLSQRHPDEQPIRLGLSQFLVVGMGKVGTGAYQFFIDHDERVIGMDADPEKVEQQLSKGRRVVYGDVEDPGLWEHLNLSRIRAVLLAVPDLETKLIATRELRKNRFFGLVCAISGYPEHAEEIIVAGADLSLDFSEEAGLGFAEHIWETLSDKNTENTKPGHEEEHST